MVDGASLSVAGQVDDVGGAAGELAESSRAGSARDRNRAVAGRRVS